jgi:hypothetical protein
MKLKLNKAEALAVQHLSQIEAGLLLGNWSSVRTAALQLAALADTHMHSSAHGIKGANPATRETK